MSADARWVRLNVDWHESDWLEALEFPVRCTWPLLLCYIKTHGYAGKCRAISPRRLASVMNAPCDAIMDILDAATVSNALRVTGENWEIVNWSKYQGDDTNRDRQRRFRDSHKPIEVEPSNALRNGKGVTVTPTETETIKISKRGPFSKPGDADLSSYFREIGSTGQEAKRFRDFYDSNGWKVGKNPMKDWQASARNWVGRNTPVVSVTETIWKRGDGGAH